MEQFTLPAPPPPPVWPDYVATTPQDIAYVRIPGTARAHGSWSCGTPAEVVDDFTWGMRCYVWRNV